MKGGSNQPTLDQHLEMHAALLLEAGRGAVIPKRKIDAYVMRCTRVGLIESVDRHLRAWEALGLIEWQRGKRGTPGWVKLRYPPEGLRIPQLEQLLGAPATSAPVAA